MRSVAEGTITQALIDTQKDASRTPYIEITIDGTNYWSRLEYLEYHEEAYRDRAIIGLNNRDRSLDSLDLDGEEFAIKLGYDTSGHGGSTTDTVTYPTLWVKSHQVISDPGDCIYQIYAEGMWMRLREQKVIPGIMTWKANTGFSAGQKIGPTVPNGHKYLCSSGGSSGATEPDWDTDTGSTTIDNSVEWTEDGLTEPYSNVFNATHTVEGIIILLISGMGWSWNAVGSKSYNSSDGIIDVFKPVFTINQMGFENAAALLYRLIWMTKHFLRPKAGKVFETVYPQTADGINETYYSDKANWFNEYAEKSILLVPNSIVVLCNQDPSTGEWNTSDYPIVTGTAKDQTQIDKYYEIVQPFAVGSISTETGRTLAEVQIDADNRAEAILSKFKSEILGGRLVAPHDCQVELYDKISIEDSRL